MPAGGRRGMDYVPVLNGKVVCAQPLEILELYQLQIVTKASSPLTPPGYRRAN